MFLLEEGHRVHKQAAKRNNLLQREAENTKWILRRQKKKEERKSFAFALKRIWFQS